MGFLPPSRNRADHADHAAGQNDIDHVHAGNRRRERRDHDDIQQPALGLDDARTEVEHHVHDDRRHARLHAREHRRHIRVIRKQRVEIRHERENHHRRNDRRDGRHDDARRARDTLADENRAVDRNRAGARLRNRRHIQHFVFVEPFQIIDEPPFHQGHDDEAAAKRERADGEHGKKQRHQPLFQAHRLDFRIQVINLLRGGRPALRLFRLLSVPISFSKSSPTCSRLMWIAGSTI